MYPALDPELGEEEEGEEEEKEEEEDCYCT